MARSAAKAILLGEHAVVYGVPALVVGLDRGATATARPSELASIRLGARPAVAAGEGEVGRALVALLEALGARAAAIEVALEIPAGVGLGASAAIAVAAARAVLEAEERPPDLEQVVAAAMAWERVFHGNPSGVDVAAAAHGGCLRFVRGESVRPVRLARPLSLAVAVAGPPASTRSMVEGLARLRAQKPELTERSFAAIASLVENAHLCLEAGDLPGLGKLLDLNQMLLAGLHLSTEDLETACAAARDAGALGAKLTGSGGGGCVLALTNGDPEPVLSAWRARALPCFATVVATPSGGTQDS